MPPVNFTAISDGQDANAASVNTIAQSLDDAIEAIKSGSAAMASPAITSFANSQHDHEDSAGGGQIALAALSQSSATTNQVPQWSGTAWVPVTVDLSVLTTKGDVVGHNGTTPTRLAVGQNGAPLVADSLQAVGFKWGGANYKYFEHEGVKVYNASNQSVAHDTATVLTWDSEAFDDSGYHDTGSNTSRLTAKQTGRYRVSFDVQFTILATTDNYLKIIKNGGTTVWEVEDTVVLNLGRYTLSLVLELNVNDYIELQAYQYNGSTTSATVVGGSTRSFFEMEYLGTI